MHGGRLAPTAAGAVATLAEAWDGSAWQVAPTSDPAGAPQAVLQAVSCPSANPALPVGYAIDGGGAIHVLAERWSGAAWILVPIPDPTGAQGSRLFGVSCAAANVCRAVGTYNNAHGRPVPLTETWNGTTWQLRAVPAPERRRGQ